MTTPSDRSEENPRQDDHPGSDSETPDSRRRLPFWRMMLSVVQASFGVQSRENKERDFAHGSVTGFIVAALVFTVLFVLILMFIVSLVTG